MLTLTLIHVTETANKLFCRFYWRKCKGKISDVLDIRSSIEVTK